MRCSITHFSPSYRGLGTCMNLDENNDIPLEPCEMSPHHNRLLLEKVADYEDKEEKGLMLILPVPLNTPVYHIQEFSGGGRVPNWFQINPVSF